MEFHFPQRVRLGQGVSQQLGLAVKEAGVRALLVTESSLEAGKELGILTHSLERAGVPFLVLSKSTRQNIIEFQKEALSIAQASRMDVLVALGGSDLLSLARSVATDLTEKRRVPYFEVPTVVCYPLLLRSEAFLTTGHPSDMRFLALPDNLDQQVLIDPHMATGQTPKTSIMLLLETLFFAVEGYFHEAAGLLEQSLLLGAIEALWGNLKKIEDNPANAEYRYVVAQAGFNVSVALACLPRSAGLTFSFALAGIAGVSSSSFGSLFLAPFLEHYGPLAATRMARLAPAFGLADYEGGVETLGPKVAQEVRKFLNTAKLPLRLAEFQLVDTQVNLAVDVVRGLGLARGGVLDPEALQDYLQHVL
jgi:alcohol dehydrogenase class IV